MFKKCLSLIKDVMIFPQQVQTWSQIKQYIFVINSIGCFNEFGLLEFHDMTY